MSQIDLFRKYPLEAQQETFVNLIRNGISSEWGKCFEYQTIKTIDQYKQRVPIHTYEDMQPWVERLQRGEKYVLWNSDLRWFAKSSGTTNSKSKFIPVTNEALEECHYRGGKDVMAIYMANHPETDILYGKGLIIGGSQQINTYNNDIYYGDLSAVLLQNLPFWVNFYRIPEISIALMDEWEAKIEKMAYATIKENVTNISGVPSWTLVLIKRILEITGKKTLSEVWQNLEVFIHGGVSFTPYRSQFQTLVGSKSMRYMETYNASEGFFSIQDEPQRDDMLLMLDYGIFYEFLPVEELGKSNPKTQQLDEVEIDKNYAMIISTNGGLWRYMIGDTIKITSKYPFKIKITGRTKHYINAFGEELIVDNAEIALKAAAEKTGAQIREYTAAPVFMGVNNRGGHQWLIEFETQPNDLDHFTEILDNALKNVNSDYEAKRYKNISLAPPQVVVAQNDLFYRWLKAKGKLGGQNKIPRLSNNRDYIDDMLKMNQLSF